MTTCACVWCVFAEFVAVAAVLTVVVIAVIVVDVVSGAIFLGRVNVSGRVERIARIQFRR